MPRRPSSMDNTVLHSENFREFLESSYGNRHTAVFLASASQHELAESVTATMPKRKQSCYSYVGDWRSMWKPDLEAIAYNGASCDPTRVHPKVLQWSKQNCSPHTPHFVKIINQNACMNGRRSGLKNAADCQLSVPRPFVREHFRELERVVTLENDEGTEWRVSFGSSAMRHPSWKQGWARVALENEFEPGEVIVFVLVANSHLRFTRFDEDGNLVMKSTHYEPMNAINSQCTTFKSLHGRTSWKEKRAAAVASRADQDAQASGAASDHRHGHEAPQVLAHANELQFERVSDEKRSLCKVESI